MISWPALDKYEKGFFSVTGLCSSCAVAFETTSMWLLSFVQWPFAWRQLPQQG